jgi:predicted dehydrogenase
MSGRHSVEAIPFSIFDTVWPNKELKSGAGILKDLGPHLIDQAVYLFGFPQSVYAISGHTADLFGGWIDILLYAVAKLVLFEAIGYIFR